MLSYLFITMKLSSASNNTGCNNKFNKKITNYIKYIYILVIFSVKHTNFTFNFILYLQNMVQIIYIYLTDTLAFSYYLLNNTQKKTKL